MLGTISYAGRKFWQWQMLAIDFMHIGRFLPLLGANSYRWACLLATNHYKYVIVINFKPFDFRIQLKGINTFRDT